MTHPTETDPILPELPAAVALACTALAIVCSLAPLDDRLLIVGVLMGLAVVAGVLSFVVSRRASDPSATHSS